MAKFWRIPHCHDPLENACMLGENVRCSGLCSAENMFSSGGAQLACACLPLP